MRIGIVGIGYWGPNLIRNMLATGRASVVCFDQNPATQARLQNRFPGIQCASSYEDLLSQTDAVMISTPVLTHHKLAKQALLAGKAVFVEKPIAASIEEAEELVSLSERDNLTLMVGHTFLHSPPVNKIKQYLDAGALGDLFFLSSSRVNLGIHRSDVDVIVDLAPHDISILLYLLQEAPNRVSAAGRACVGRRLDMASLRLEFPSGVFANIEVSWLAPRKLRRMALVGRKAMVVYDDTALDKIQLYDRGVLQDTPDSFGEYQLSYKTGDTVSPNLDATEPMLLQANHFLDCVETGIRPISDGRFGLNVVRILDAAERSVASGGGFVDVQCDSDVIRETSEQRLVEA